MKEIQSINEIHQILIGIANAFADVCKRHDIPYFMIGGTMLGAIRHKGFIPWDDDMDFGVYSEDYERLMACLKEDLPYPYRCISFENCEYVKYPFFKIEDRTTCVKDKTVDLSMDEMPGLNIDIFPVFPCRKKSIKSFLIFSRMKLVSLLFLESSSNSRIKKTVRTILRFLFSGVKKEQWLRKLLSTAYSLRGNYRGNLFGRWKNKETFPEKIYASLQLYPFGETAFYGIKDYDVYLHQMYGDYMTLPAEDKRLVHIDNIYKK